MPTIAETTYIARLEALVEMLQEAALRLNRHQDLEQLLHDVVDLCMEGEQADSCFVYLYDSQTGELVLRAANNSHPDEVGRLRMRIGEGITGWVAQQRRPVAIASQAMSDPRFKFYSALPEDQFEAFLSVPILYRNVVLGVINLQHRAVHQHDPAEIKALTTIGFMLGEALDRSQQTQARDAALARMRQLARFADLLRNPLPRGDSGGPSRILEALAQGAAFSALALCSGSASKAPRVTLYAAPGEAPLNVEDADWSALLEGAANSPSGLLCYPLASHDGTVLGLLARAAAAPAQPSPDALTQRTALLHMLAAAVERDEFRNRCLEFERTLEDRKIIERAKGIIQKERNVSEEEAYRLLQQESRRNRKPMVTIAQALLTSRSLVSDNPPRTEAQ